MAPTDRAEEINAFQRADRLDGYDGTGSAPEVSADNLELALREVAEALAARTVDLPPEVAKALNDHFRELYEPI